MGDGHLDPWHYVPGRICSLIRSIHGLYPWPGVQDLSGHFRDWRGWRADLKRNGPIYAEQTGASPYRHTIHQC